MANSTELESERRYVAMLYGRLDALRAQAARQLGAALRETGGTPQARTERDSTITRYTDQVEQFNAVESGLAFGRLDFADGGRHYLGRIGIFDEDGGYEPLLMDWRAPAARPFYLATAASPLGVTRRRHLRTRARDVVGLDDEVLDLATAGGMDRPESGLTSEAALLAAVTASRTGAMRDIVQTIQAEQDRVIRDDLGGVLVVQGGPGTGKTAVALHRAAYLLYTHRRQLTQQGVLIVGPNATFLRYIAQVLPSLAETGVLLRTVGDLFPGVSGRRAESPAAAEIKGRLAMAEILAAAVRDRQRVPDEALEIPYEREVLRLPRQVCERARGRARRSGRLHNLAREILVDEIIDALADEVAALIGTDPYADDPLGGDDAPGDAMLLGEADLADIRRELRVDPEVQAALDWLWPVLTPQQLVGDLLRDLDRIGCAAPRLTDEERTLLWRPEGNGWTPADAPLLDEAAELLGEDDASAEAMAHALARQRAEYARGVLEIALGSQSIDVEDEPEPELLQAIDVLGGEQLSQRQDATEHLTAAQRAAVDRRWALGHVIVDEAQELSPMAWRLLMRRCPSRSMTIVGDVAQTGDLAGAAAWRDVLAPYVADRWRLATLSVNYRTPAEVMELAARVLAVIDPTLRPPRSVRSVGAAPWLSYVDGAGPRLTDAVVDAVRREAARVGDGRLGVIVPSGLSDVLSRAIAAAVPEAATGQRPDLANRVVVLTVRQAKGLEFDSVLVVEPGAIVAESARGYRDLYVALTRATQRLGLLYSGELPTALSTVGSTQGVSG